MTAGFVPPPYPHDRLDELRATCRRGARRDRRQLGRHAGRPDARGRAYARWPTPRAGATGLPAVDRDARVPGGGGWLDAPPVRRRRAARRRSSPASAPRSSWRRCRALLSLRDPSRDTVLYPAVVVPDLRDGRDASPACARCRCRSTSTGASTSPASTQSDAGRALRPLAQRARQPDRRVDAGRRHLGAVVEWAREHGDDRRQRRVLRRVHVRRVGSAGATGDRARRRRRRRARGPLAVEAVEHGRAACRVRRRRRRARRLPRRGPPPRRHDRADAGAGGGRRRARRRRPRRRAARALPATHARPRCRRCEGFGLVHDGGPSTFYLWLRGASGGADGWAVARRLAEHGLVVAPGDLYGPDGADHVRLSLTVTDDQLALGARPARIRARDRRPM